MEQPLSLISAQVHFVGEPVTLVHIPLDIYPFFIQPILGLLFHDIPPVEDGDETGEDAPYTSTSSGLGFFNLSVTPVECSVICSRQLAERYFAPLAAKFNKITSASGGRLSISKDDFIVMQIDGQGLDASQRVLELSSPLAMAGISIFFISTYFSDYILVPARSKGHVVRALEKRGFTFESTSDTYVNNLQSHFMPSSPPSRPQRSPPGTPPPSNLSELQNRTFASLRRHNIVPRVDTSLRLVQCCAHHEYRSIQSSCSILRSPLTTVLLVDNPRFLSLTLTPADPAASILLEQRLLPRFSRDPIVGGDGEGEASLLLGSKEDILVPIMLDLRDLPLEATGIVCGVAGRLADATQPETKQNIPIESNSVSPVSAPKRYSFDSIAEISQLSSSMSSVAVSVSSRTEVTPSTTNKHALSQSLHRLEPDPELYVDAVEISFLSTARAGTVIVGERELGRAVEALKAESRDREAEPELLTEM